MEKISITQFEEETLNVLQEKINAILKGCIFWHFLLWQGFYNNNLHERLKIQQK
jgi:hypothetical protein